MLGKLLFATVLLAGLHTPLAAQTVPGSGASYLQACRSLASGGANTPDDLTLSGLSCAIDIDDLAGVGRLLPVDIRFCKPADVSIPQMAGVAASYLDAHADRQQESFLMLAGHAFHEKWPCS